MADTAAAAATVTVAEKKPRVVFVLGGPGAGKGTQCALLVSSYEVVHLSAGDLLRAEQNDPSSTYATLINDHIKEGKIVPVEIVVKLLLKAIDDHCSKGSENDSFNFLIDGFPRSQDNYEGWVKFVGDKADLKGTIFFDLPEPVMEARLLERGKTSGRADDNIESIKKRFKTFWEITGPVVEELEKAGKIVKIAADRAVEEVFADTKKCITALIPDIKHKTEKKAAATTASTGNNNKKPKKGFFARFFSKKSST